MNTKADRPIKSDHNQDERFEELNQQIEGIQGDVSYAAENLAAHDQHIHEALGQTLDLGLEFIQKREDEDDENWTFLKAFLDFHKVKWSSRCEENIFHGLVDVSFNFIDPKTGEVFVSASTRSKYRTVLKHAYENGLDGEALTDDLKDRTFRRYYEEALKTYAKTSPLDKYVEDDTDRYQRAVKHLAKMNAPILDKIPNGFEMPNTKSGFLSAVVHNDNGQFKVVGFDQEDEAELRAKVSGLVPDEAVRNTKKLREKNMFWLYVVSDFYTRFLPKISDIVSWNQLAVDYDVSEFDPSMSNEEVEEHLRQKFEDREKEKEKRKTAAESAKKTNFAAMNALQLVSNATELTAYSLTTLPNTPCIEIGGVEITDDNLRNLELTLTDIQANGFVESFLAFEDFQTNPISNGLSLVNNNPNIKPIDLRDYSQATDWRLLDQTLQTAGQFELGKHKLLNLGRWKSDFSRSKSYGRHAFQNIQSLDVANNNLNLLFPHDPGQNRILGSLTSNKLPSTNSARFFDYRNVIKLGDFAKDYGVEFELEWLEGHQGASALKFHVIGLDFKAAITLPMLISIKGNPIQITA